MKSLVVLVIASVCAYFMLWTDFDAAAFHSWLTPTAVNLGTHGMRSQTLGDVLAGLAGATDAASYNRNSGVALAAGIALFVFASRDFRGGFDNIFGGVVIGLAVIVGSFLYAVFTHCFRFEWFANRSDLSNHVGGGVLMGVGGVLSMGRTIGQAITGVSTPAIGSLLTFIAIVAGSAATMKYQYWRMTREA